MPLTGFDTVYHAVVWRAVTQHFQHLTKVLVNATASSSNGSLTALNLPRA